MKKIFIIYTGGTIGMVHDARSNSLKPFDFEHIIDQVPELSRFGFELHSHSFNPLYDSSNMHPTVWMEIAGLIEKNYSLYDGFVILHGSDTMAYTASALSFMFENLGKPIVMTGSQLPIGEIRTDAKENLVTAIEIAACDDPVVPEVSVLFDYQLYRGNRTTKYNSAKFQAFRSVNYPALAEAGVHIRFNRECILPVPAKPLKVLKNLDTHVGLLKLFPGISNELVSSVLNTKNMKALVLETFGAGNASTGKEFQACLEDAMKKGLIILDVTQCLGGSVELGRYETSAHLKKIGVISGKDITTEAAIAKLMFLLGQGLSSEEVARQLQVSLRGEMSE